MHFLTKLFVFFLFFFVGWSDYSAERKQELGGDLSKVAEHLPQQQSCLVETCGETSKQRRQFEGSQRGQFTQQAGLPKLV